MWAAGQPIGKTRPASGGPQQESKSMRRVSILLAGTALAVALGATAFAQTGPGAKSPGERFRTQFFDRLDSNRDGRITKAEYEASRAAEFKAADKNGDGFVSRDEFAAYDDQRRGDFVDRMFARLDKNNDGKLDAAELAAGRGTRGDKAERGEKSDRAERGERRGNRVGRIDFERADAGRKGYLTLEDLTKLRGARAEAAAKRRFERLDTNRDGKLTADELPAERKDAILRADANKDGAVTLDEFQARPRQFLVRRVEVEFKALDADGDGRLTKAEIDAVRGKPMLLLIADADKDGAVTKDELARAFAGRRGQASGRVFQALDADKDGKISAAEWQAAGERRFARLDRNKDGDVTADDLGRRGRRGDR
jgi:Ca2+-binding EF-hand superfamily protein